MGRATVERSAERSDEPETSDEVAVGRALQQLGERLLGLASDGLVETA